MLDVRKVETETLQTSASVQDKKKIQTMQKVKMWIICVETEQNARNEQNCLSQTRKANYQILN